MFFKSETDHLGLRDLIVDALKILNIAILSFRWWVVSENI